MKIEDIKKTKIKSYISLMYILTYELFILLYVDVRLKCNIFSSIIIIN